QLVAILSQYALKDLGLRKLYARVVDENTGSARVLTKNGYALEAELKDFYRIDGRLMNCHIYSRYGDEFETGSVQL
ncbi:MAG TPA: GNAT family protein, partial [Bacillota bacterium]|nr:GNAT family protein [Bacillota bacterium]